MIRTGEQYRESIRDGREVWIDGERVDDVTTHPAFKPIVDVRARIYDLAHEDATRGRMSYVDEETGERCPIGSKLPLTKEDWHAKRRAVDTVLDDVGGIVTRVGDETVGEMWSLYDGQDVLNEIDPRFSEHIRHHVRHAAVADPFHVSANTDPKGDRSKRPQDQDPDVLLRVVARDRRGHRRARREVRDGGGLRQPGVRQADDRRLGRRRALRVRGRVRRRHGGAGHQAHLPLGLRRAARPDADYPLSNRFDEIDTMIVFDDVEIPWENVFFYRHTRAAAFIRATLHRYSMFPFVQRHLRFADLLVGAAYANATQTGVKMHQGVREKLAELACYRESINAHLTAAIELAEPSPGGLLMPNQALLYDGPRRRLLAAAGDDAPGARPVRRPDLRHPERRDRSTIPRSGPLLKVPRGRRRSAPRTAAGSSPSRATC